MKQRPVVVVDIGCGDSAPVTKWAIPTAKYLGLDVRPQSALYPEVQEAIDEYRQIDLSSTRLPDEFRDRADIVILAHVLEHLDNGLEVLAQACELIREGGLIYVEYPRFQSTKFPSMSGTLNFWDDRTHVRLYHMSEILNVFNKQRLRVLEFGTRRYWRRVLISPFAFAYLLAKGSPPAVALWDIFGFAEYAIAARVRTQA